MSIQKKILIPGGKFSDWALVNAAHRLGLYVITSGTDKNAPAHKFSDEYVCLDYSDHEAMLKLAEEKKVDYMCSCANDFGMLSTAYVCEKLGLPGHDSYQTCWDLHHKDTFKPMAKKLGLHSPISEIFTEREAAIEYLKKADRQMIIKPTDNVASIGVSKPTNEFEIERGVDDAFAHSKTHSIVVEPFITGFFAPVTSMIINQKVEAFFVDGWLFYPEGEVIAKEFPISERTSGMIQPCPYIDEFAPAIIDDFNKIAQEMNLVDGKLHCELMITPEHEAYIFDIHRRMSGFYHPWPDWNITTGLNWEDWIVRAECGMDLSEFPKGIKQNRYFHKRNIYAPKNGIIKCMKFDEYLTSHMCPKFEAKNFKLYNIFVSDHRHLPIIDVMCNSGFEGKPRFCFEFDTAEEANYVGDPEHDHFYEHIEFEYAEF